MKEKRKQAIFFGILVFSFFILFFLWLFQTSQILKKLKKDVSQREIYPREKISNFKEELSKLRQLFELNLKEIQELRRKLEGNLK